jgi:RsiW-degrading membrane proteinase PrsW (M82 family)
MMLSIILAVVLTALFSHGLARWFWYMNFHRSARFVPAVLPAAAIIGYCFYLEAQQPYGPFYALIGLALGGLALLVGLASAASVKPRPEE